MRQGTLFYYGKSKEHTSFAQLVASDFGTRTVDLVAPRAGFEVERLTGSNRAMSPTLVLGNVKGSPVVSSMFAVRQFVKAASFNGSPFALGRTALILIILGTGVGVIFAAELRRFAGHIVFCCLFGLTAVLGGCLSCHTNTNGWPSIIAPIAGLVYTSWGALLFSFGIRQPRWAYLPFLIVSALVPSAQAALLTVEPKLCLGCLLITFSSIVYTAASLAVVDTAELQLSLIDKRGLLQRLGRAGKMSNIGLYRTILIGKARSTTAWNL